MSIPVLIAGIGMAYGAGNVANGWYEDWHDDRYPRRNEVLLVAQAARLEEKIEKAQTTADETSRKVDSVAHAVAGLQVSAAITAVGALQIELDRHERNPENSDSWHRERERLHRQIEMATAYRDCLQEERANCDRLRGW